MSALEQTKQLCENIINKISQEQAAAKPNKANHTRLRNELNQLKKLITSAKAESIDICKK